MKFSKLQATGNDFLLTDARTMEVDWPKLAQAMCDRHFGVGADGLMLVQNSAVADLRMRLFNSDGSEAEVSGNGLRCFAKYAIEKGLTDKMPLRAGQSNRSLSIESLSGVRKVQAYMSGNRVNRVEVNMGLPRFQAEQIPVNVQVDITPILNYPLMIDRKKLTLSLLSMGNPHAVSFLSRPVGNFPLAEIGPKVERHAAFPQRTNFEVARVLSRGKVEARVWERGVGETLACGSGASAIAVAAQLLDYVDRELDIMLPGGTLTVSWDRVGEVLLTGAVEEVFTGEWLGDSN
ncbi:MAG: diaminopimelate epimerase [Dehalococcoidia bacterium]|nr:diaminopimelate epimerase [Dehalococcoidia bacterium]MDH4299341.1 diaminopimelate epimerase [Dehalococcoidia bacterium]MDH4366913.1 diaminopimelate epimerase [Dehalococcoidia bacterium]